ncbi:hypothetical protein FHS44_006130 [Streptosporangium saharense]|uniref:Uncharacterized protein n=1 Tax=Streptosporangium saharense TaxID=1706840 RepID=A0A7W7QSZ1_9ACTN|nr:hypothetical protein [Streptosporangium saharense]
MPMITVPPYIRIVQPAPAEAVRRGQVWLKVSGPGGVG